MTTWVKSIYTVLSFSDTRLLVKNWFFTLGFLTLTSDFYGEQEGSCIEQCNDSMERNDYGTKCRGGIVEWFYAPQSSVTVNFVFLKQVQISLTQKIPLTC